MTLAGCALCETEGGVAVFRADKFRAIRAEEAGFPAFYRLVWNAHVAEFSDLSAADRHLCMEAVTLIEAVLRRQLQPTKVNLATLGNVVPHLHWHVIARFDWDSHFPAPVWGAAVRPDNAAALARVRSELPTLDGAIRAALATLPDAL
ncbi:HIT family protein [Curvibacter delicatus]|jgi:diadenosine tetraphosphate (Ap4A) HIT family hydrolase|uniref:HIT family protein n=1 Tax=Curvibacter delicatus TaxID=80879 RepID=UPI00082F23EF|nr:HIT family protein [Curvibacter delicatus]